MLWLGLGDNTSASSGCGEAGICITSGIGFFDRLTMRSEIHCWPRDVALYNVDSLSYAECFVS